METEADLRPGSHRETEINVDNCDIYMETSPKVAEKNVVSSIKPTGSSTETPKPPSNQLIESADPATQRGLLTHTSQAPDKTVTEQKQPQKKGVKLGLHKTEK